MDVRCHRWCRFLLPYVLSGTGLVLAAVEDDATSGESGPTDSRSSGSPLGPQVLSWIPEEAPTPAFLRAGELAFFVGARWLEGPIYQQLGPAVQVGVTALAGPREWAVKPCIGLYYAHVAGAYSRKSQTTFAVPFVGQFQAPAERGELDVSIVEGDVGAIYAWSYGRIRQNLGGGLCWVRESIQDTPQQTVYQSAMDQTVTPRKATDANLGWWLSTSLTLAVAEGIEVGAVGRYSDARLQLFDQVVQAGGWQAGVTGVWVW